MKENETEINNEELDRKSEESDSALNEGSGTLSATNAYKRVYSQTRNHKAAVRAYCGNNKWAIENAKGTGNW